MAGKKIGDIFGVGKREILGYLEELGKSKTCAGGKAAKARAVRGLFCWLIKERRILFNPWEGIGIRWRGRHLPREILSREEMEVLLNTPNTGLREGIRDRALLELLYSTGIRLSEVVNLNVGEVDLKAGYIYVREGKGKKDRLIPVGRNSKNWLEEYLLRVRPYFRKGNKEKEEGLFLSLNGERLGSYWVTSSLREYGRAAKINKEVTVHILRHTVASHLILGGANVEVVRELLGHKLLETTSIYTHVYPTETKETHRRTHPREAVRVKNYGNKRGG